MCTGTIGTLPEGSFRCTARRAMEKSKPVGRGEWGPLHFSKGESAGPRQSRHCGSEPRMKGWWMGMASKARATHNSGPHNMRNDGEKMEGDEGEKPRLIALSVVQNAFHHTEKPSFL